MKKKIVCILVVVFLLISLVSLTACDIFRIPITGDENTINKENEGLDNKQDKFEEANKTQQTELTLEVNGKTFVFDTAAIQYTAMLYPDLESVATEEEEEVYEDLSLPSMEEMQLYINEVYSDYYGSKLIFKDGIVKQEFLSGVTNEYNYKQKISIFDEDVSGIYIGYYEEGQFVYTIEGSASVNTVLLQMVLDETFIVYLQFVLV